MNIFVYCNMDSTDFFKDADFTKKWKGKSGIFVIENPLFTKYAGCPVYKTGYARCSLYTCIADYRTAYVLAPYKIHAIHAVPETIIGKRVNYTHLTERILQETASKYGEYAGVGEWFKQLPLLLNIVLAIGEKHLKAFNNANK